MALYATRFGEARGISRFIESATKLATWEMEMLSAPVLYSPKCLEEEFCELRRDGVLRSWGMRKDRGYKTPVLGRGTT